MNNETLKGIFIAINDAWSNFTIPQTPVIMNIWKKRLGAHDERTIMNAIEELYSTEHFFSFAKLIEIIGDMTKPELPSKADVIADIKKMATNSRQDISDRPEIIQQTIRHAGGLIKLGQRDWDQWIEKEVSAAYDEAVRVIERDQLLKLGGPEAKRLT